MPGRSAFALAPMTDDDRLEKLTERSERLSKELGAFRLEMREELGAFRLEMREDLGAFRLEVREEFGKVRVQAAELRAEVIDRDMSLLKWLLGLFVAQTAALGALMAVFR